MLRADEFAARDQGEGRISGDGRARAAQSDVRRLKCRSSNKRCGHKRPELDRPITVANRQIAHMSRLVSDLLHVSRVMQGKITLERKTLALNQIVAAVAPNIQPRTDGKNYFTKGSMRCRCQDRPRPE